MRLEEIELTPLHVDLGYLSEFPATVLLDVARAHRLTEGTSITAREMLDDAGSHLYPAYFWTHLTVPAARLLRRYRLWDHLSVGIDMKCFAGAVVDSTAFLCDPGESPLERDLSEYPSMRAGTMFVVEESRDGVPQPATPRSGHLATIPDLLEPPAAMTAFMRLREGQPAFEDFVANRAPVEPIRYRLLVGRDLVPGKAVMFATFVKLFEHAERTLLTHWVGRETSLTSFWHLLERETYYLSNAKALDHVRIEAEARMDPADDLPEELRDTYEHPSALTVSIRVCNDATGEPLVLSRGKKLLLVPRSEKAALEELSAVLDPKSASPVARPSPDADPQPATASAETQSAAAADTQQFVVAATFTAEPIAAPLRFWLEKLNWPQPQITFAPYNQVFQQLLDPQSAFATNTTGANIALLRLEDWGGGRSNEAGQQTTPDDHDAIERSVADFAEALSAAANRISVPTFVAVCPSSPRNPRDPERAASLRRLEDLLSDRLRDVSGVFVVSHTEMSQRYPVTTYYDPDTDRLGHVPYTPLYYTALATALARRLRAVRARPIKAIVLDCDNTLWKGVCGEDGPSGVQIDGPFKALQEFMLKQHDAGRLLCLCSKNNEADVWATFDQNPDMPLRREHITAHQINWQPKSKNLRELSETLQLGLDSFVFVDDNPVECADVGLNCPQVLTLNLPEDVTEIPTALDHYWPFDILSVTAEDRLRADSYKQNVKRTELRRQSMTLVDFIASLEMQVTISKMADVQVQRVAQLTRRTNQFNTTTIRRDEADIKKLCDSSHECLVVEVSDRFGDYGLVGVILFSVGDDSLEVDSILLSCRALGRGVEYQMLSHLGAIAKERGLSQVSVAIGETERNRPVRDFLARVHSLAGGKGQEPSSYVFASGFLSALRWEPEDSKEEQKSANSKQAQKPDKSKGRDGESELFTEIARKLSRPEDVVRQLPSANRSVRPQQSSPVAPSDEVEAKVLEIFQSVLRIDGVGIHDEYGALGGQSLQAIQILARVQKELNAPLTLDSLGSASTVATVSTKIRQALAAAS